MIKYFRFFIPFLFLFFSVISADIVESRAYQFYFDAPSTWVMDTDGVDGKSFLLHDPSGVSTITITAFSQPDRYSLQDFKRSMSSVFNDDWMVKFERKGTSDEKRVAHVMDSMLSVYSRYEENDLGNREEIIVGDYYLVTGNYGYVIRVRTPTRLWSSAQVVVKQVVSTFGHGRYQGVSAFDGAIKSLPYVYGWECDGVRPDNSRYSDSVVSTSSVYQTFWSKELEAYSGYKPVILDSIVCAYDGASVMALNSDDGSMRWSFLIKSPLTCNLIGSHGLVYVSKAMPSSLSKIFALSVDSGQVLFSMDVTASVTALRVDSGLLFVSTDLCLTVYDAVSGELIRKRDMSTLPKTYPALSDGFLYGLSQTGLFCLDAHTLERRWVVSDSGFDCVSPIVSKTKVLAVKDRGDINKSISAFDVRTGNLSWTFDSQDLIAVLTCSVAAGNVFVSGKTNSGFVLYALSLETGQVLWKRVIVLSDPKSSDLVCATSLVLENTSTGLTAFSFTGIPSSVHFLKKPLEKISVLDFCVFDNQIFTVVDRQGKIFLEGNK